jgi:predicted nucleotidyltransferase component of viral defense system
MKEFLKTLTSAAQSPVERMNLAREYLQARILESLQRSGAMIPLAFHGGTALRFIYAIPRFSEDLDFALERPESRYDFRRFLKVIQGDLAGEGYDLEIKVSDVRTVHSAYVRFQGLLHELDISPHVSEVLSIKIEVDTDPPAGAKLATTLVRRHITLRLQHHDRASLLSGKLHALLQREYTKGRDLYDLMWYLSDPNWPTPNLDLLSNALKQTGWGGPVVQPDNWRSLVLKRLESLDWSKGRSDMLPFLERPKEIELLTLENFVRLLSTT